MAVNSGTQIGATLTCTGALNTTNFAYFRIEVRSFGASASEVHFYADTNTANGVQETECGTGLTGVTLPGSSLSPWLEAAYTTNTAASTALRVDYFRSYQDDNLPASNQTQSADSTNTTQDGQPIETAAPITPDPNQPDPNVPGSFFNFLGATSEDTVINGNLFVHGTIYADKIKANEIEGLSIFTDQLASLQQKLQSEQATTTDSSTGGTSTVLQTATTTINLNDGLTVGGDANFHGNAFFYKLVTFTEKTLFNNDVSFNAHITTGGTTPTYNLEAAAGSTDSTAVKGATAAVSGNDNSGTVSVSTGDNSTTGKLITVTFAKPFDKAPQVVLTATNGQTAAIRYYVQSTATGFTIYVIDGPAASTPLQFNYFVIQ